MLSVANLDVAREKAHGVRSDARREEEATQAGHLATAREEANADLASERKRIASETEEAREALGVAVHQLLLLDAQAIAVRVEQAAVGQLEAVRVAAGGGAEL